VALKLPVFITSKKDILKLRREAEKLSNSLLQSRVAADKSKVIRTVYKPSQNLTQFMAQNGVKADENSLAELDKQLQEIYDKAPQVRLSFASEPDQESLQKLTAWFRTNANPMMFVQVGIQPMIAGGCILRTPKMRYDFSLRTTMLKNSAKLREAIANVR